MKKNLIFLLAAFATLGVFANTTANGVPDPVLAVFAKAPKGEKVSPVIEAKFKKQFGNANVTWSVVDDASDARITIGAFKDDGEEKEVYYYDDGEVFGIGETIRRDQLPENVTKSIKARFTDGALQTAYEFKERSASTKYFVRVVTPRHSIIVSANEFGETRVYQKERLRPMFH